MEFKVPVFDNNGSSKPARWEPTSRFVLDQDTGGAINGPHRVDLYWGSGDDAGRHAGVMKEWGKLYYLVPKQDFIVNISNGEIPDPGTENSTDTR